MIAIDVALDLGDLKLRAKLPGYDGTTVVVGPNGAGKSTLLKTVLGLIKPRQGTIELGDRALFSSENRIHLAPEDRRLGYVPQSYALFSRMTVSQNVGFGIRGTNRIARQARVKELLEDLGIEHLARRKSAALSGGESQRVALARALAIGPRALLLDEPMAALDAGARRKVRRFLAVRLRAIGIPTIVVSHDVEDVEALGGRIAVLEEGTIVQVGTLQELRTRPATPFVREFLNPEPVQPAAAVNEVRTWGA